MLDCGRILPLILSLKCFCLRFFVLGIITREFIDLADLIFRNISIGYGTPLFRKRLLIDI